MGTIAPGVRIMGAVLEIVFMTMGYGHECILI